MGIKPKSILDEFGDCGRINSYDIKKNEPNRAYVAGSVKNISRCKDVMDAVRYVGWDVRYDWTRENQEKLLTDFEYKKEVIKNQLEQVKRANIFVLVTPGGRGSYVELGVALANKIKSYILLDPNDKEEVLVHSSTQVHQVFGLLNLLDNIERDLEDAERLQQDNMDIPF